MIFDFSHLVSSKKEAFKALAESFGKNSITGVHSIPQKCDSDLLLEVRFKSDSIKLEAKRTGICTPDFNNPAISSYRAETNFTKVNLREIPLENSENICQSLFDTMSTYGKVLQIRLYVDPEYEWLEGEVTVILDTSAPSDSTTQYEPLACSIFVSKWDVFVRASWQGAPQFCRYCKAEGHTKFTCPKKEAALTRNCFSCGKQVMLKFIVLTEMKLKTRNQMLKNLLKYPIQWKSNKIHLALQLIFLTPNVTGKGLLFLSLLA